MTPSEYQALSDQLIRHEGLRLKPYTDTVGKVTIGVGRNLTDVGISHAEAMHLLTHDIERTWADAQTFPWFITLDAMRQRVILDMLFNLGRSRFMKFKATIAAIEQGDYAKASTQMLASLWARQVGRRADVLAEMMRTGTV